MTVTHASTTAALLAILVGVTTPATAQHEAGWLKQHGTDVRKSAETCTACHTRESCLQCHIGNPQVAKDIPLPTPGNEGLAKVERKPPDTHQGGFRNRHATMAAATPQYCAGCHVRSDCLSCHRPDVASGAPGYHPAGFLSRHPAAAYAREVSCSACHNPTAFCVSCHQSAGLVATRQLMGGYHDGKQFFLAGHGQAARQSLESCVGCHAERDCMQCHTAQGLRHINPHGPSFNAEGLKKRNAEMCLACHLTVP